MPPNQISTISLQLILDFVMVISVSNFCDSLLAPAKFFLLFIYLSIYVSIYQNNNNG